MKVALDYDKTALQVKDPKSGCVIATWSDLEQFEIQERPEPTPIADLVKLKEAGFTTEEIIELRKKELI